MATTSAPDATTLSPVRPASGEARSESSAAQIWQILAERSSDVILELREGLITYISPNTNRVTGLFPADFVGQPFLELAHPDDRPTFAPFMTPGFTGTIELSFRVAGADGEWQWREARGVRLIDDDGAHRAVFVLRDVNDRLATERTLQQVQKRTSALLTAIPDLMFRLTRDGVCLDFKAEHAEDLYVPPEAIIGNNVRDLLPLELAERLIVHIECALDDGGIQTIEYALQKHNGLRDYETRITSIDNDEVVVIARDVTEQRKAERERAESERKYREIIEQARDVVYVHDLAGNLSEVNRAGLDLFGYSADEVRHLNFAEVIDPAYLHLAIANMQRAMRGEEMQKDLEFLAHAKDGSPRWLEISPSPVRRDGEIVAFQGIARDVTERRLAEGRARVLEERALLRRERTRIAEELHDSVAQYFFGIGIAAKDLAERDSLSATALRRKAGKIRRLATEGSREVRNAVSALAAVGHGVSLDISIERLADEALGSFGITVGYQRDGSDARLRPGTQRQLFRFARETIFNACKHAQASTVSVQLSSREEGVTLTVRDDGAGESSAVERAMASAVGFGLPNLREQIERAGGHVEIRDNEDRGISVICHLPMEGAA